MKNLRGLICLFLGIFLFAFGVIVKFAVAPAAVKAPLQIPDQYRNILGSGDGFELLDPKTLQTRTVSIFVTRHLQGDVKAGNSKVAVYDVSLCLTVDDGTHPGCVKSDDPRLITILTDRVAYDRVSGNAVKGAKYRANVDGDASVQHQGLSYKFPFGTKKRTYQFFDPTVGRAFPAVYSGSTKVKGLTAYRFVQNISAEPMYTNHVLASTYSNTRTILVEPKTGLIVGGSEVLTQVLTGRASLDPSSPLSTPDLANKVALKGTINMTSDTTDRQVKFAKESIPKIDAVKLWLPLIAVLLGLVFLGLALLFLRSGTGSEGSPGVSSNRVPAGKH